MEAAPPSWHVFVERRWSPWSVFATFRRLLGKVPTHVFVQYPTQGYGWSVVPHMLVALGTLTRRYRGILVLHEFSSLSSKAKLIVALTSHFASAVIFTTAAEREQAKAHRLFARRGITAVVPILNNIPASDPIPSLQRRGVDIAYFGHIRPRKGVEAFLDLVAASRELYGPHYLKVAMIGQIPPGCDDFAADIIARCQALDCTPTLDLDDLAVSRALADVRILYLPFPDGASARRGSILAGLANGALVAARVTEATPSAMIPALLSCTGTTSDAALVGPWKMLDDRAAAIIQAAGRHYLEFAVPRSWSDVVSGYESVLRQMDATS